MSYIGGHEREHGHGHGHDQEQKQLSNEAKLFVFLIFPSLAVTDLGLVVDIGICVCRNVVVV